MHYVSLSMQTSVTFNKMQTCIVDHNINAYLL